MRDRIESKHVTKEIKSQMPVIPVEIIKERGCTFCPYYLGNYEKQPRCMMKTCAWDDENERFHPVLSVDQAYMVGHMKNADGTRIYTATTETVFQKKLDKIVEQEILECTT